MGGGAARAHTFIVPLPSLVRGAGCQTAPETGDFDISRLRTGVESPEPEEIDETTRILSSRPHRLPKRDAAEVGNQRVGK